MRAGEEKWKNEGRKRIGKGGKRRRERKYSFAPLKSYFDHLVWRDNNLK